MEKLVETFRFPFRCLHSEMKQTMKRVLAKMKMRIYKF